ncbi:MAG: hypothetical protein WCA09_00800 [Burkholderiales bacterium]
MLLEAESVDRALACDVRWLQALKSDWLALVALAVWGGLQSARIGALPRLRKRILELGEKLAALGAPPQWIAQPRERLKLMLATALAVRELLAQCAQAVAELEAGAQRNALDAALQSLAGRAGARLDDYAARWAGMLDAQLAPLEKE